MKLKLVTLLLTIICSSAICQTLPSKTNTSLSAKINAINAYIAGINQRHDLKESKTAILMQHQKTGSTMFTDPATLAIYKIRNDLRTCYYSGRQLVCEEITGSPAKRIYYSNGRIIFINYDLNSEKVLEITYTTQGGGKNGGFYNLKITSDSLVYSGGRYKEKGTYRVSKANNLNNWITLTNSVKLIDLANIKSGESEMPIDGGDETIEIISAHHIFSVLNGSADINYKKIMPLVDKLKALADKN